MYDDLKTSFWKIAYCRDILYGKGQRDVAYQMIYAFYQVFPVLALKALHLLFAARENLPPVGSWCDVKYFCIYISKVSPLGFSDPLIEAMIRIANRHLDKEEVRKWIPRESHHPELYSLFVRDWFSVETVSCVLKKNFRKIIASDVAGVAGYRARFLRLEDTRSIRSDGSFRPAFPTMFIGEYVKTAVRILKEGLVEKEDWLDRQWNRLLRFFPMGPNGLAVVDLNAVDLHTALGYACLIAEKMKLGRILLSGPICVDVSGCGGFMDIMRLLLPYCEIRMGVPLAETVACIWSGMKFVFELPLRVFVFSETFDFDVKEGIEVIFWNLGDPWMNPFEGVICMSGKVPGLLMPFLQEGSFSMDSCLLQQYSEWAVYFDSLVYEESS